MKIFIQFVVACLFAQAMYAQSNTWTQKADFGGIARQRAVGFSIGSKGYMGTGVDDDNLLYKDFWEYDPYTNTWTQKADFGGTPRAEAVGFSIGSKGYVGTGSINFYPGYLKDFWEYDPSTNTWTQKADFVGIARYSAVGFSIGSKGYMGTGYGYSGALKDFWEYDPVADNWIPKGEFKGTARQEAIGFNIGNKGYLGTGYNGAQYSTYKDFWEYDPSTNAWTQKADFGGEARLGAAAFSIDSKGYLGTGNGNGSIYKDFWEYDPAANEWKRKADFEGGVQTHAVGFNIGIKGYLFSGQGDIYPYYTKNFWEYTSDNIIIGPPTVTSFSPTSGPVGTTVTITGANFGASPAHNIVYFGATKATVIAASTTSLMVTAPGGATYEPITVTTNSLTAYSAAPFVETFPCGGVLTANSFSKKVELTTGYSYKDCVFGDLDGDGKPELIVSNNYYTNTTISVFRNISKKGTISFADKIDFDAGKPNNISIGDLDGDGKPELVITQDNDTVVSVLRNTSTNGNISFADKIDYSVGWWVSYSASINDLDGDGKPDIVVANFEGPAVSAISVLKNNSTRGNISFAPQVGYGTGFRPSRVSINDFDGDGKPDVVFANQDAAIVSVLKNTTVSGNISFADQEDYTGGFTLAVGDLDRDGKPDIITSNSASGIYTLSALRNISTTGTISFAEEINFNKKGNYLYNISIGDLDGDGKPDLAVSYYDYLSFGIFRNISTKGVISFDKEVDYYISTTGNIMASIGDLDLDHKQDIVSVSQTSQKISVFKNEIRQTVPVISGISDVNNSQAIVHWNAVENGSFYLVRRYPAGTRDYTYYRPVSDTCKKLSNLVPAINYNVQVSAVCPQNPRNSSNWSAPVAFTTLSSTSLIAQANSDISKESGKITIQITPNPSKGNFTIQMQLPAKDALTTLALYNSLGVRIWQQQAGMLSGAVTKSIVLDNKLSEGMYILRIERSDVQLMQKVVVSK